MPTDGTTPNAGLSIITPTRSNWANAANNNFKILDTIIGAYFVVNQLQGIWTNSTMYAVDDSVIDSETCTLYQALEAHTSSTIPTTFKEEREAHSSYWGVYQAPARGRGIWEPDTQYLRNDFVVNGGQYAIALENHTSGSDFDADVNAGKWSILVDLSAAGSVVMPVPGGAGDANKFTMVNNGGTGYTLSSLAAILTLMGVTSIGQAVMQAGSQADGRSAIGAQIAGSYQAASSYLSLISGLAVTASRFPYVDNAGVAAISSVGAFGLNLVSTATAAQARGPFSLGLGAAATLNTGVTSGTLPVYNTNNELPGSLQVGDLKMIAGTTVPSKWLLCYGQAISRATYSALFTELDVTWGVGDGSTTFNIPDLRGRVPAGQDDMGGSSANRLTGASGGVDGDVLGASGGAETHTLDVTQIPAHTHSIETNRSTPAAVPYLIAQNANALSEGSQNAGSTGGGLAHNNVQPTTIVNYIIYTGV